MSEVNIDAALIEKGGANLSRTDETLVEMTSARRARAQPQQKRSARNPCRHFSE